jgi:hypothetical protein
MNRKQLIVLLVCGAVIGGLGFFVYNRQTASWNSGGSEMGKKVLPEFPLNDVAHVIIKQPDAELNLVKSEDKWRVKERWNYPANFSEVSELLRKIWELKTVRVIKVGQSDLGRLELQTPAPGAKSGTLLQFKDKAGKDIQSLVLGKKDMRESSSPSPFGDAGGMPVGRYVLGAGNKVSLVGDPLSDVEAKPDRWLNKDFFKVEKLRSISVTSTNATNSWKLVRETEGGELKLAVQGVWRRICAFIAKLQ